MSEQQLPDDLLHIDDALVNITKAYKAYLRSEGTTLASPLFPDVTDPEVVENARWPWEMDD